MPKLLVVFNDIPDRSQQAIDLKSEQAVIDAAIDVEKALAGKGYDVQRLAFNGDVILLMEDILRLKPDAVFNLFEGAYGLSKSEVFVPIALDLLDVEYTGSQPKTLETCVQKAKTKKILKERNVSTPDFQKFDIHDEITTRLKFPIIVKPEHEDASIGISNKSVVRDQDSLREQVTFIWQTHAQPALIEEFILGREFNIALLGGKNIMGEMPTVLPVSEISFETMPEGYERIVTYKAKWEEASVEYLETKPICPAPISRETEEKLQSVARRAWDALGCRDYARVDMRLAADGTPYVIDVNPNPDISMDAGFARSAKVFGLDYAAVLDRIAKLALERAEAKKKK